MSAHPPLLSLLIPTKDRYETLSAVVSEITTWIRDDRLEIVICDNSTVANESAIAALRARDSRIVYRHSSDDIPITENTERGIALCSGEYLCFIGDDDLVSPHIMGIVDWLKHVECDCLIYPPARYWWQNVVFASETLSQRPGVFWLPKARGGEVRKRHSVIELSAVLARGGVAYMDLPRLYHGIVSRTSMERVRETFGCYLPGSSPDMSLCMTLALTTETYLSIDYPVTVFGASRNSGGGLTAARKHYGRIEDQRMLPRNILDNWDDRLPRIWSEQVIYPQTIHEIMSRAGRKNALSYPTLYGSLVAYEPHILKHLLPVMARYVANRPTDLPLILTKIALKIAGRIRTILRSRTGMAMPFDLDVLPDVKAVMAFMMELEPPALTQQTYNQAVSD